MKVIEADGGDRRRCVGVGVVERLECSVAVAKTLTALPHCAAQAGQ